MTLKFGKYAGMDLADVPLDYLEWMANKAEEDKRTYSGEIDRRAQMLQASKTVIERIIIEGHRALSKKYHPDAGGNDKQMADLNASKEWLIELLKEKGVIK